MSIVANRPSVDRVIVRNVRWETYESLLEDLENSGSPRLAFDRGVLEIMSPHMVSELLKSSQNMVRPAWIRLARQQIRALVNA